MFFSASKIHDGYRFLPEGTVLEVADDGSILNILDTGAVDDFVFYEGILCPGFVNAHCHLELSHLKGKLDEHTGLIPFLQRVPSYRSSFSDAEKTDARQQAYDELLNNGIVAVGDISNTADTLDLRAQGKLHVHSFVECIGFIEQHAMQRFEFSKQVYEQFSRQESDECLLRQSLVPHAPYSVSSVLFQLIDEFEPDALISIHNQEAKAEDEYYRQKTGAVKQLLEGFGIDDSFFTPSGKSSLTTYAEWISPSHPVLLVHNTQSTPADVHYAENRFPRLSWCLCPNANLYLEGVLPDVPMLAVEVRNICVGTDSLASNHQLSIMSELVTLHRHFPQIGWEVLLRWATINGAVALQMDHHIGSFTKGKKPGVLWLQELDSASPAVKRLI